VLRFRPGAQPALVTRLPVGLRYSGVAALGSKIYVAGGLSTSGPTRAVYAVDPAAGTVSRVAMLPAPVDHVALAPLGSRLLLVGGGSRQVLAIDPATGTVRSVASLPQALTDPAAVADGGRVVVLGGGTSAVYALG
jgi:outer membrane protein assembly factor BamB